MALTATTQYTAWRFLQARDKDGSVHPVAIGYTWGDAGPPGNIGSWARTFLPEIGDNERLIILKGYHPNVPKGDEPKVIFVGDYGLFKAVYLGGN